ncbi:unnamed protein product [Pleuronectes platessa]|uniref:Uncharacterized protein n=1 Tax=Pleuronectes platessa TaxID=8262 RepID=A0A9N7Z9R3_PLEPL|nr:unnamed protein product [Pleuronectes platessa]
MWCSASSKREHDRPLSLRCPPSSSCLVERSPAKGTAPRSNSPHFTHIHRSPPPPRRAGTNRTSLHLSRGGELRQMSGENVNTGLPGPRTSIIAMLRERPHTEPPSPVRVSLPSCWHRTDSRVEEKVAGRRNVNVFEAERRWKLLALQLLSVRLSDAPPPPNSLPRWSHHPQGACPHTK